MNKLLGQIRVTSGSIGQSLLLLRHLYVELVEDKKRGKLLKRKKKKRTLGVAVVRINSPQRNITEGHGLPEGPLL